MSKFDSIIESIPTAKSFGSLGQQAHGLWARRTGVLLLVALVVAGLLGVLGPAARQTGAAGPSGSVELRYPSVTRPGLDSEVTITLEPAQAADTYRLAVSASMMSTLGIEQISPEPEMQTSNGSQLILEFAGSPAGEVVITFSGRVPTQQAPGVHDWEIKWVTDQATVPIEARTWTLP